MRHGIVRREDRDGSVFRVLSCGHEQPEPEGGEAARALTAFCRPCSLEKARTSKPTPPPPKPVDTRTELQRLADDVLTVWSPPGGRAWGLSDVKIKKLIDAARTHACPTTGAPP